MVRKINFLKILAGDIEPTTGNISLGPDRASLGPSTKSF